MRGGPPAPPRGAHRCPRRRSSTAASTRHAARNGVGGTALLLREGAVLLLKLADSGEAQLDLPPMRRGVELGVHRALLLLREGAVLPFVLGDRGEAHLDSEAIGRRAAQPRRQRQTFAFGALCRGLRDLFVQRDRELPNGHGQTVVPESYRRNRCRV